MKNVLFALAAAALFASPANALDWSKYKGKFVEVYINGEQLSRQKIKKCRKSPAGYCHGRYRINEREEILGWSGKGEFQWFDLRSNGTGTLRYRDKSGNQPNPNRTKSLTWAVVK